jgi:predicted MFS family arabinose efflux permease
MPPILNVIAATTFASALSSRSMDPVLPLVADGFGVSVATAASLSAVVALTFAIVQPLLGAAADMFGKPRLMIACLILLGAANALGLLRPRSKCCSRRVCWSASRRAAPFPSHSD